MCMEDVRIGRDTATTVRNVGCPEEEVTLLCVANPDRYSLLFQIPGGGVTRIRCQAQVDNVDFPLWPVSPQGFFILDLQQHGDLVCQPWACYANGGSATIVVTETVLRRQ